jgi:cell division protein FtsA
VATLETIGISVIDITLSAIADYEALKDEETNTALGAVVNIGAETTIVSIFNKGILINTKVIQYGGSNIDSDIAYIYKIDKDIAKKIKETFAVSHKRYANVDEIYEIVNDDKKQIRINQYEITEVVYYRLIDIFKIIKNDIKNLTNKEINYIIITGGASEMIGFKATAEEIFPCNIIIKELKTIGIRNSKFSTNIGMINYFNQKLLLKGKEYSMISEELVDEMVSTKKQLLNINNDSVIGKLFGYFFDN